MVTASTFIGQLNLFTLRLSGKIRNNYPHWPSGNLNMAMEITISTLYYIIYMHIIIELNWS